MTFAPKNPSDRSGCRRLLARSPPCPWALPWPRPNRCRSARRCRGDHANDGLKLDQVVVTGTSTRTSKMKSSVSVSTLDSEQLTKTNATSAAELLRSVPGLRSESSGGEGNANLTVRGVPLSAGGSRYVQFQEDGLPVLMFGDIAFGTADQFLRADYNVDRLEVVRGGSASTLTSNSPGGIINFISKTGAEAGGAVALSVSPDPRQLRLDADYGGKLGPSTTFHIGGFQRVGEGGRPTGFNAEKGGQIRANVTQKLDNGYVRVSFKNARRPHPDLPAGAGAHWSTAQIQDASPASTRARPSSSPRACSATSA